MSEGYVNLFINEYHESGDNKPHYKGFMKIEGVEHEFALWPAKEGKKGFSGKYKPKEVKSDVTQADADKAWADAEKAMKPKAAEPAKSLDDILDENIPF